MEKAFNIKFKRHRRTSLHVPPICDCVVYAKNKDSARELVQAIVRDLYNSDYMIKQYSYIIEKENI